MCQLIFCNLNNPTYNQVMSSIMIQTGSSAGNRDGTGFFGINKVPYMWKTSIQGDSILDLGKLLKDYGEKSKLPIAAHVRDASPGIEIIKENAHPFKGDRFILVHNGRLYGDNEEPERGVGSQDKGVSSDSKKFLDALELIAKENPKMPMLEMLNKNMEAFMGKFALMILDTSDGKYYIAKGETAPLHIARVYTDLDYETDGKGVTTQIGIDPIGFVVMTKKDALAESITIGMQMLQIASGKTMNAETIDELKNNTLYVVDGIELKELGEIKEKPVKWKQAVPAYSRQPVTSLLNAPASDNLKMPFWQKANTVYEFMERHFLDVEDIDKLFYIFLGIPLAECDEAHIDTFIKRVMPRIGKNKTVRRKIRAAMGPLSRIYPNVYSQIEGLEYPWMINDKTMINKLVSFFESKNNEFTKEDK